MRTKLIRLSAILAFFFSVVLSEQITLSSQSSTKDATSDLHIGDSIICNDISCYPKVFEATNEWKEIKPAQMLPGGLDVRINLESGLKEAKLVERMSSQHAHAAGNEADNKALDVVPIAKDALDSQELQKGHEFTKEFTTIRDILAKVEKKQLTMDITALEEKLDDVMEFAHDYKHGFKIISNEFDLLENMSFNAMLPVSLRELSARMINSCLRNNPPALNYINDNYPDFKDRIFYTLEELISSDTSADSVNVLLRRYLSTLNELLPPSYVFTPEEIQILRQALALKDKQLEKKVLEIASRFFSSAAISDTNSDLHTVVQDIQGWVKEFETAIQNSDVDELHIREFFNSLYNIKQQLKTKVTISSQFLDWLELQSDSREKNLNTELQHRDLEQDSFDKRLIESRHLVFGNPMAQRIKQFDDEL
ncbi:hypothetical protein HG535_0E03020 [Zygotorulaspora mrakii]|uniref:Nucleotide exchange factor SIL1 n=1 Tax=Zygotorulaspora mrakii TaxID=42260 RepID=A0A7H9B3H8_ZYGMR|nr:uncharacterized protein HG535_0E03020 [Zygotorulaspora mrakii]QLG73218.1 hypothetical protein HG535_0E03020 [Zygotorulaspora mrakii]